MLLSLPDDGFKYTTVTVDSSKVKIR